MNFQQAVQSCLAKYATFSGRAARSEFWYWQLFLVVAGLVAEIFDFGIGWHGSPLTSIFWLVTLVPALAVAARRLHDVGRSAWWLFLYFVPVVGWIALLVWFTTQGTHGYNGFGADPLPHESRDTRHRVKAQEAPSV
jgi:uncharacterized membrane protein YhaH (DUF805 family)